MKRLAICIDDLGHAEPILRAAGELAARGRVQAMSLQVHGAAADEAAQELKRLPRERVEVGLHFDLTETPSPAWPRAPLRSLIGRALAHRLDAAALRAEAERQIDRHAAQMGRWPDYVDGHQHVHQLPQVREALLAAIDARPGWRPWLRRSAPAPGWGAWLAQPKAAVIGALGSRGLARAAGARGLGQNRALLGIYGFDGAADAYAQRLDRWFAEAHDGDLLMAHPAAGRIAGDGIAAARVREFEVLSGPRFDSARSSRGVALQTMRATLSGKSADGAQGG